MSSELLQQVLKLPPTERLELVEEIWGSLNGGPVTLTAEDQQLLDDRLAADERDPDGATSWEETRRIVNQEFKRRREAKRPT